MNSLHPLIRFPLRAISAVVLSLVSGVLVFLAAILGFFVAVVAIIYCAALGAIVIGGLFALLCWLFLGDPNALRGFGMFTVFAAVGFAPVFLVQRLFIPSAKPQDAPFIEAPMRVALAHPRSSSTTASRRHRT